MQNLIVEDLLVEWADFVLRAQFYVQPGERLVLWGPSGSGKSTLLRVIAGLETYGQKKHGRILLGEKDLTRLPPQSRNVGFVFQDQVLFPHLSVLENTVFGLKMRGVSKDAREAEARSWLDRVGLAKRAHSSVDVLSVGERQRVAFIRALIWKPQLILLDEPFSALDPALRATMRNELLELHRLSQAPLILVTHDQADVDTIAQVQIELKLGENPLERTITREE